MPKDSRIERQGNRYKNKKGHSLVWEMMLFVSLTIIVAGIIIITVYVFSGSNRQNKTIEKTVSIFIEDYYADNLTFKGLDREIKKDRHARVIRPLRNLFFVCDEKGQVVYPKSRSRRHDGGDPGMPMPQAMDKHQLEKGYPLYFGEDIVGYIFIVRFPFQKKLESTLVVIGVVIFLTVPVCGIFIKRKLKPLDSVLKGAAAISSGDYSFRVDSAGSGEIAQLIDQFNRMAGSIEDSDSWKKQIISDTAHELRTPITLLLSRLEMMSEGIYPMDHNSTTELHEDLTRLSDLVSNLQKLSSLESKSDDESEEVSKEKEDLILIPLFSLLRSFISKFEPLAKEKEIQLRLSPGCEDQMVLGNLSEIEQVFVNLFSNAIDFTPENGEIRVGIQLKEGDKNYLSVRVEDTGPGIPAAERENVFERFYRIDKSRNRKHGGSGLGLTISRIIVEKHGGEILLSDSTLEDGGLCVEVLLPLNKE